MKGGGAPAQQEQPAALVFSHVAELGADQVSVLEIVVGDDGLVSSVLLVRLDQAHVEVVEHVWLGDMGQTQGLRHETSVKAEAGFVPYKVRKPVSSAEFGAFLTAPCANRAGRARHAI
jgi:hypothetical protein